MNIESRKLMKSLKNHLKYVNSSKLFFLFHLAKAYFTNTGKNCYFSANKKLFV